MKVYKRVSELQTGIVGSTPGWSQFTRRHNYLKKTVGGVMVLVLGFISSDDDLYLYQVSRKYLKGFQSY